MDDIDIIRNNEMFKDFTLDEIIETFSLISFYKKNYNKNEIIVKMKEKLNYIGIILSGKIAVANIDYFGNRNILTVFESGYSFGEAIAILGTDFPNEILSLTNSTVVWIEYESIIKSNQYNKIINNLLNLISMKNYILNQKVQILSKRSTRDKILEYLLNQKKLLNIENNFEINLNRNEMADYLALDRSNLSRELSKLKKEGIIDFYKNKFKLL